MSKIRLRISIINENEHNVNEITGIIQDDILKYIIKPYKTTFNYKTNTLINESDNTKLTIEFNKENTKSSILYKPINKELAMDINTIRIEKNKYNIEIEYEICNTYKKHNYIYRIEEI